MKKRAYIIHGWEGYPEEAWFPWLKGELEARGFEVLVPVMPEPEAPKIESWVPYLADLVGTPDKNTYLVGHSMGCQTILRYLAGSSAVKIGGAVLVAGFVELRDLDEEEEKVAGPWVNTPIDFNKVKQATNNITAIFSNNDRWVPLERNIEIFKQGFDPDIVIEKGKGHFSGSDGIKELPSALAAVLKHSGS